MKYFVYISLIFLSPPLFSNEVEIIKLHENKSLDQLVLDQIENENSQNLQITNTDNDEIKLDEEIDSQNLIESENINNEIDIKENIWNNIDPQYVKNVLNNTQNIRSKVLQNEFNNFLFNLDLNYELDNNKEIFYNVVEYFYKKRDISKAYLFLQSREKPNDNNLEYYNFIEANYFLSTTQLDEACNFINETSISSNSFNNFYEKLEIFCLILNNKLAEAELLNSILEETQKNLDINFQRLFLFLSEKENSNNSSDYIFTQQVNNELIFLYSAMASIAEIPLNEKFLEINSVNIIIPIILNQSTPIELRIKAANLGFISNYISIESLSALYQSVDFDSSEFNNPKDTIQNLSGNIDLLMAYYYQLINVQIFPSERLQALINFWDFAKQHDFENIAYALSYKIIDSIEVGTDYIIYSPKIALAYIYNKDFEKAFTWITFYENSIGIDEKSTFAKILINLNSATEINSIVELISSNFIDSENSNTKINKELLFVFFNILGKDQIQNLNQDFDNIYDNRLLPSLFITENINAAIADQDFNNFLINVVLSLNNKEWKDLHPIYLNTVISGFLKSENKEINKKIILEIFNNYQIL